MSLRILSFSSEYILKASSYARLETKEWAAEQMPHILSVK